MNFLVVVLAQLLLLFYVPGAQGFLYVAIFIFTTDQKANLTRRIGWDGSVAVLDPGKDLETRLT